jgi:hypothetical protein
MINEIDLTKITFFNNYLAIGGFFFQLYFFLGGPKIKIPRIKRRIAVGFGKQLDI